jgi:Beta-lactamase enzyme family/CARDB
MRVRSLLQVFFLAIVVLFVPLAAAADSGFQIGPIPGLTTAWHPAPDAASIPLEVLSKIELRRRLPSAGATVEWSGATEVLSDGLWSVAECPLSGAGQYVVIATTTFENGSELENRVVLDAVAIRPESIEVSPIRVEVDPVELDEADLNASTYEYYRGFSIAGLRRVSDNWYRTSTRRPVHLSVAVDPPGFAPLMEWRSPVRAPRLGSSHTVTHVQPHIQQVSVGPTASQRAVFLETYSVEITSHVSNQDVVPEGEPVTFSAVTSPPGHEDEITWLASTKYGSCDPVMGQGPEFTVRFENTWGPHPAFDQPFQWLGVKADHTVFNQDTKCPDLKPVPGGIAATPPFSFCEFDGAGLKVTVKNHGLQKSGPADLFVLRQSDGGDVAQSFGIIPMLASMEQVTLTVPLAGCCGHLDMIQVVVDSNDEVDECNEDNNVGFSTCITDLVAPTNRVVEFMQENTDGNVGILLKEIGGPVRATFNADTVFEPASSIKVLIHLHGMLEVLAGPTSLDDEVFWLADDAKVDDQGNYHCGGNDCYVNNTIPQDDSRTDAHRLMMECSDNALTQALRDDYGDLNIDATIGLLGLGNTALNHSIGCGPAAVANHNRLTLADLASLHEQVATGLLTPGLRSTFYDLMSNGTGFINAVVDEEAPLLGIPDADAAAFKAQVRTAWKGGSYGLSDGKYRSLAGWLKLPFACEGISREYFFGAFIDQATDLDLQGTGTELGIFTVAGELLREELRAALVSSQCP